jgi:hypothetical protein
MKTLLELMVEANDKIETLDAWEKVIGAVPVLEPDLVTPLRKQFKETEPYLYCFLKKCVWYKVTKEKLPPEFGWQDTMAVAPFSNGIKFYYNEKFLHSLDLNELVFLICHESGHIFRFTSDRIKRQHLNHELMNIAADMVINHDILNIKKVGPWEANMPKKTPGLLPPEEYVKKVLKEKKNPDEKEEDYLKKGFLTSHLYRWLEENKGKQKPPPGGKKPLEVGDIVKINKENKHGKITKITKNKADQPEYEIEEIDLKDEIKQAKEDLEKEGKKV